MQTYLPIKPVCNNIWTKYTNNSFQKSQMSTKDDSQADSWLKLMVVKIPTF
jgi:hypothetical protein